VNEPHRLARILTLPGASRRRASVQEQNENIRHQRIDVGFGTNRTVGRCAQGWRYPHHVGGRSGASAERGAVRMGDVMTRILNDFLLFACATLFVTGIVLAAAKLLI
jgi:hypothetical protein